MLQIHSKGSMGLNNVHRCLGLLARTVCHSKMCLLPGAVRYKAKVCSVHVSVAETLGHDRLSLQLPHQLHYWEQPGHGQPGARPALLGERENSRRHTLAQRPEQRQSLLQRRPRGAKTSGVNRHLTPQWRGRDCFHSAVDTRGVVWGLLNERWWGLACFGMLSGTFLFLASSAFSDNFTAQTFF